MMNEEVFGEIDYSWDFTTGEEQEELVLSLEPYDAQAYEDQLWQAKTGLTEETLCGAIETLIFMSDHPIALQKIKNNIDADIPLRAIHGAITKLQTEYENKHHGIRLMEVAQGYQFRTKAMFSSYVQKLYKITALHLGPSAMEVLSMIAYKQPVSKTQIEKMRGVDSSHIVRTLMDKRLVKIVGRSEELGRPTLYGTTSEFLEVFNLSDLSQLPSEMELEELVINSNVSEIADIKTVVNEAAKSFDFDEMDELEALSKDIKGIVADTVFTKKLNKFERDKKKSLKASEVAPVVAGSEGEATIAQPEPLTQLSAFDILEGHISEQEVEEQNKEASVTDVTPGDLFRDLMEEKKERDFPETAMEHLEDFAKVEKENLDEIEAKMDEINEGGSELFGDATELANDLEAAFLNLFGEEEQENKEGEDSKVEDEIDLEMLSSLLTEEQEKHPEQ